MKVRPDKLLRMNQLLRSDNITQYNKEFDHEDDADFKIWVQKNVIHVDQRCPHVYRKWKNGGHSPNAQETTFHRWLHTLVVDSLTDLYAEEKTRVLRGHCQNEIEAIFYQTVQKYPSIWYRLPPSWIGSKDSEQREAAQAMGFKPQMIAQTIISCWSEKPGEEWSTVLAYPHSLRMLQCISNNARQGTSPDIVSFQALSWGAPEDIALAQHLLDYSSQKSIISFVPNPNTPSIAQEANDALKTMVSVHAALGNLRELAKCIAQGQLPLHTPMESMELPDLDASPT